MVDLMILLIANFGLDLDVGIIIPIMDYIQIYSMVVIMMNRLEDFVKI
jgi:hypothetical protein